MIDIFHTLFEIIGVATIAYFLIEFIGTHTTIFHPNNCGCKRHKKY